MKITFDSMTQIDKNTGKAERGTKLTESTIKAYAGNIQVAFDGKDRVGFGTEPVSKGKTKVPQETGSVEAQVQNMRNQMTVMSHTMSDEDFVRMQEEGYDPSEMDPQEAVTILDKIKAELLKAGECVQGFTDNLDRTTLIEVVGSEALAATLMEAFRKQDIPLDKQNAEQVLWALEIAKQIQAPTESTYYYMAANGMDATLQDFYRASASGSSLSQERNSTYFAEEVNGYITKNVNATDTENLNLDREVVKLLEKLNVPLGEEEQAAAKWLVEKGLPVDAGSIERLKDILSVEFPLKPERIIETSVAAIAEGKPVGEGKITDRTNLYQKAYQLLMNPEDENLAALVKDRRLLEELRLQMTVEANLKLLKSGFLIDTAPMEETIEALKQIEQELAHQYFPKAENPQEKYQLFQETNHLLKELPGLPLATVGKWSLRPDSGTLAEFHKEGQQLAATYKAAGERYETLWTAPRADLGDSIKKAFANVDEILKDLNYEATEENRKAVRALGYNRMELTEEHIEKVKQAQRSVDRVIRLMTPAATLKMIRDGVNPLESSLPELQQYFEEMPEAFEQRAEKYSKFLYQLQSNGEITPQEREAFIGCYRLLNQLEKSDGAAIGALVNTNGEINFANLLSAIRSNKLKSLDIKVNDMVGALTEDAVMKFSISEQIEQGYQKESAEYTRQQYKEAAGASREGFQMLQRGDLPASAQNLVAAAALEQQPANVWEALLGKNALKKGKSEALKPEKTISGKQLELWQGLEGGKQFAESYESSIAEAMKQVETETLQEAESVVDIRSQKLLYKQLHIMQKISPNEEYYFPMEIQGEVTGVHLQFTHNEREQGLIRMTLESDRMGRLCGYLQVTEGGIQGYFVGNEPETVMNLKGSTDIINSSIRKEWTFCEIEYIYSDTRDIPMDWTRRSAGAQVSNERLYGLAKDFLQAVKAVGDGIEER